MLLVDSQLFAFSTEVLRLSPAVVGLLVGLPRIWDAVTDPILGYASDRLHTRFGRRRPFILIGGPALAFAFVLLWSPPRSLGSDALAVWIGVSLVLFYSAITVVDMPHAALGAELSRDYDERTRISGTRRIVIGFGTLAAVGAIFLLNQPGWVGDARSAGTLVGVLGALLVLVTCTWCALRTSEPPIAGSAYPESPFRAYRDVLRNPHAVRLLAVALFQQAGVAALVSLLPLYSAHVVGTGEQTFLYFLVVILASFAGAALALRLAPRFDKRSLILTSMAMLTGLLACLSLASRGDMLWVLLIAALAGIVGGILDAIGPSLQADVVDFDELQTGERKEGAYFASWTLVAKSARGIGILAVSLTLSAVGFEGGTEQPERIRTAIGLLSGAVPALLLLVATVLFLPYRLTREVHAQIRAELAEQKSR